MPSPGDETTGGQQTRRGAPSRALPGPLRQTGDPEGGRNCMRAERGIPTEHPPTLERFPPGRQPGECGRRPARDRAVRADVFPALTLDKIPIINARQKGNQLTGVRQAQPCALAQGAPLYKGRPCPQPQGARGLHSRWVSSAPAQGPSSSCHLLRQEIRQVLMLAIRMAGLLPTEPVHRRQHWTSVFPAG